MRQKINEEISKMRISLQREIKAVRELLLVPGVIGIGDVLSSDDEKLPSSQRERRAPLYKDFCEFANA